LLKPSVAVFGEKDWQQLQVIRWMSDDLGLGIDIPGVPTIRETDGLAMSSRNRFLTESDRQRASAIARGWKAAQREKKSGAAETALRRILDDAGIIIEYATVRDARMLMPLQSDSAAPGSGRILIGARLGSVRLLDNAPWPL
jgi:pantoate--beta-alanine ligase